MNVFLRTDVGSRPPRLARDERVAAIFAGTPLQVAGYVAARMAKQPETLAPLTAELTHLANEGRAGDSLCMVLADGCNVTIRP
jgi:hypothetical protein